MSAPPGNSGRRRETRSERLRQRKVRHHRRALTVVLYLLAAAVAFGAVGGAALLAKKLVGNHTTSATQHGYVAVLTVGVGQPGRQPLACLVVNNPLVGHSLVFAVPRTLLLTNAAQEYIMAGTAMQSGGLARDLSQLIDTPVNFAVSLSYSEFVKLLPPGELPVIVERPASLNLGGGLQTFRNRFSLTAAAVPTVLSATGKSGADELTMQIAVFQALLQTAALQSQTVRAASVTAATAGLPAQARGNAERLLNDLLAGNVPVTAVPAQGSVAEGQFAYRPNQQQIMAQITRRTPAFVGRYTVLIQNGNGDAGIGDLVARRLATLDVNLASPTNATTFNYQQTQIITGSQAVGLGENIRAILGRGVVLSGANLPATTVVVVVGKDISVKDLQ
ncbi:MAG: LytR C-terminal domain-containing protein [Thermoleophilia bacterium]